MKSSPHSQLEDARMQQQRPSTVKNKIKKQIETKKKEENNMLGIKATHKKLLVERNTEKERIKW